jgi:hypothetical protein
MIARAATDAAATRARARQDRIDDVAGHPDTWALEFVELRAVEDDRLVVRLHFIADRSSGQEESGIPPGLTPYNVRLIDADKRRELVAEPTLSRPDDADASAIDVELAVGGGQLLAVDGRLQVLLVDVPGLDRFFDRADFSLSLDADELAQGAHAPAPLAPEEVAINYLAKDYASFVQLMNDRLRLTAPRWIERNPADLGTVLVEALAHAGDLLSYYQDAVAGEANLGTARVRSSLRRHAQLLDYTIDDGANARAWIEARVPRHVEIPAGTRFVPSADLLLDLADSGDRWMLDRVVFESMHASRLRPEHNAIPLYGWGLSRSTLPAGATTAVLKGAFPRLRAGDVVILRAENDANGGPPDPDALQAVRLFGDPVLDDYQGQPITRIEWSRQDALKRPLLIGETDGDRQPLAVAAANVILADHGATVEQRVEIARDFDRELRIPLRGRRVAVAEPYDHARMRDLPAVEVMAPRASRSRPCVRLFVDRGAETTEWTPRLSLWQSGRFASDFTAEIDGDDLVLRFGDGIFGRRLLAGTRVQVKWRCGGGPDGNVARDLLSFIVPTGKVSSELDGVVVTNPLPAEGGRSPEPLSAIVREASVAFRAQERCVTAADFDELAMRVAGVSRSATEIVWGGSRDVAVVHVLPVDADLMDRSLCQRLTRWLAQRCVAGLDVEVRDPELVPIAVGLRVGVERGATHASVRSALQRELGTQSLEDGRRGHFHRDAFGFGDAVYLAPVIARATRVRGVAWVVATRFERADPGEESQLGSGCIAIGPVEIARLAGVVELDLVGGAP